MSAAPSRRRWLLGLALVATLAAVWFAPAEEESLEPAPRASEPAASTPGGARTAARADGTRTPAPEVATLAPRTPAAAGPTGPIADAFAVRDWRPQPTPAQLAEQRAREQAAAAPPPPPAPQVPPVPFRFVGRIDEAEGSVIFLAQGERNYVVRAGESVDSQWRLDAIGAAALTLTYVPLGQSRTLPLKGPR